MTAPPAAAQATAPTLMAAPSIALPKGGGAIRGMGESFAANPATGTGTLTVPLDLSPGRGGSGPTLSLSYDSGAGNGPFGLGWTLSLPSITRKTDKGVPRYEDAAESDVFLLSGAEDLVPVLAADGTRVADVTTAPGFTIHRYRPRVEGLFARIERWTSAAGDVHWRSISNDNVLTVYGKDDASRIRDPADAARVYSWLVCETRDDRGNAVVYEYRAEDGAGVDATRAHERNRGDPGAAARKANRYLKRVKYGNRAPFLDADGNRPRTLAPQDLADAQWMFEVVLDYGEHDALDPRPGDAGAWEARPDAFSTYRAGFEVRTLRLCRRVLIFHHFPGEPGVGKDCLVRSIAFTYDRGPVATYLTSVARSGHRRAAGGGYVTRALPPLELEYSRPEVGTEVQDVDAASLENLPAGVDGASYQWVDLDGDGVPGVLAHQGGAWRYKRNESPLTRDPTTGAATLRLAPMRAVDAMPAGANLSDGAWQFLDLAGDGQQDLVRLSPPHAGFHERTHDEAWSPFRAFGWLPHVDWRDADVKLVDLTGDGHADILLTREGEYAWHGSRAEEGFGDRVRVAVPLDEERGPRVVFSDGTQSVFLADLSGDGLTDLVRVRNGEVCYWPNLGHGRFGAKVTMDDAPWFDDADQFDPRRIRLADVDGSGVADVLYLGRKGARYWPNHAGNAWGQGVDVPGLPVDRTGGVAAVDLLGDGTTCLVWSSDLPGATRAPMKYVRLMKRGKPHLLVGARNNLGGETRVRYAPSTFFALQDRRAGRPWRTRLPFPVQVVERVETYDHVGRNRFVTRYAYHHGHFDGPEREFRGFGMVEQWDTEEMSALVGSAAFPAAANESPASHVPPVRTRTWYHTGLALADPYADEYWRAPGLTDAQAAALLLHDARLPEGLTAEEEREAFRALKGSMLRQEVYADDGTAKAPHPYTVAENAYAVRLLQPRGPNPHAVFLVHSREALTYHHERDPADPRVAHALTLEVDAYGNVLKEASVAYARRAPDASLAPHDQARQARTLVTLTERAFTNAVSPPDAHRAPLPCEARTFELTGYAATGPGGRYVEADLVRPDPADPARRLHLAPSVALPYEAAPTGAVERRLVEHSRTLYRPDDLGRAAGDADALLPLGVAEPRALTGESYSLAYTRGLLDAALVRNGQPLLPDPAAVLAGPGPGKGGYVLGKDLKAAGRFPASDPDEHYWLPTGRAYLSPTTGDAPAAEHAHARAHFYHPVRYRDPFHAPGASTEGVVTFDAYDLLMLESRDAAGNRVTVGERRADGSPDPAAPGNDYRVLQPRLVTDPDGNRTAAAFDALGHVAGTAVMGKRGAAPAEGDSLAGFEPDLSDAALAAFFADPRGGAAALLGNATTRVVTDPLAYWRTRADPAPRPAAVATLARETHVADLALGEATRVQVSVAYSDGFGREVQKKAQAEPGPLVEGGPVVQPRWVSTGWVVHDNKGNPVRAYEPYFTATHAFEFGVEVGVSPILFYDPVGRVVATLRPDRSYEKVVFTAWAQATWDANDASLLDPRADPDVRGHVARYFAAVAPDPATWTTWHGLRKDGAMGPREKDAAQKAAAHADTPTLAHLDALGRPFLTLAHNGRRADGTAVLLPARVELDVEGNVLAARDADAQGGDPQGRVVARTTYDVLGRRLRHASMDAGARWTLVDAAGKPLRAWDDLGRVARNEYDVLRRPLRTFVRGARAAQPQAEVLVERLVYGEQHPEADARNLRGSVHLHLDQAGAAGTLREDFKANVVEGTRRFARERHDAVDWSAVDAALPTNAAAAFDPAALEAALAPLLEGETFTVLTAFDALGRPVRTLTPHTPAMRPNVIRNAYNEANLLDRVDVNERGATAADGSPAWTPFVTNVDYDAKGQRRSIEYGNGTRTTYDYDPNTFRLVRLVTRRDAARFPADGADPPPAGWPGRHLQSLSYTYDAVGNVVQIRDDAQQAVFFHGKRVEPSASYAYDATYRLVEATGREHLGLGGAPQPHSSSDAARVGLPWAANDGNAMGTYVESYAYDAAGNLLEMRHRGDDPANPGWTRRYAYEEPSLLEPAKACNRLSRSWVDASAPQVERLRHDAHGNVVRMPHLAGQDPAQNAWWDHEDQLRRADLGGGGNAYYAYDAAGQRVRKTWEKSAGLVEERLYFGGFEVYRRKNGAGAVTLERETLHVMDDQRRVAILETRTVDLAGDDPSPGRLPRYQLTNHLDSAVLELDDGAAIVSYEEYAPYGSTTYQAVRSQTETPKRYRFAAKERDEETGLYHHGARYYAPWLGRWMSADPIGTEGGSNLYLFAEANPVMLVDPSGLAPEKYQKQRGKDTAAKRKEMEQNLADAKKKGHTPDPMQKRAEKVKKDRAKKGKPPKSPIEQHHHKDVQEAAKRKMSPKKMGDPMSSVWSTKKDPAVQGGIGDKPVWDKDFDGKKKSHHNIAKHLDKDEQRKVPKTVQGLEDAAKASKERLPATVDMTERAKHDWKRVQPVGPEVDPKTGIVKSAPGGGKATKAATEALETAGEKALKKLGTKALKVIPFVGVGASLVSAEAHAAEGNKGEAALEVVGTVPVVGDVVDAARLGVAIGETANELLGIEEVAAEHGTRFENAAKALGASGDTATLIGATGAALSSITVAPTQAAYRKIAGMFD